MAEYVILSSYGGRPVCVRMGWKRSSQCYYLRVEYTEHSEGPIYDYERDPNVSRYTGLTYFVKTLIDRLNPHPKAGPLEALHIAQTVLLTLRSTWLLYAAQRHAAAEKRQRLRACLGGLALYALSAVDYAVNYGANFYPPGVIFIAVSLGIIAVGVVKFDLMRPNALAATVAHEVRTPLTTIRMQAAEIARAWPDLIHGYRQAVDHGLCADREPLPPALLERVSKLSGAISAEVTSAHQVIEMALASVTLERLDERTFSACSLQACVTAALAQFAFQPGDRDRVHLRDFDSSWHFIGSETLLMYVLFNPIKNALHAIQMARKGDIESRPGMMATPTFWKCGIALLAFRRLFFAAFLTHSFLPSFMARGRM